MRRYRLAPRATRADAVAQTGLKPPTIRVWDPLVRIAHWSLAGGVVIAWISGKFPDRFAAALHDGSGYAVLGVVALRLAWGFSGPRYARFAQFVRPPARAVLYLKQLAARSEPRYIGHNPLGGWMIVALLSTAALAAGSGWLYTTDRFWGEAWLEQLHHFLADGLLLLAGLHVAGVVFTSARHGENLVLAMLSGRKRPPRPGDEA